MLSSWRARLRQSEFARNLTVLMSGTAMAQALPILAAPIMSRLYSPHEMGIYTAFMSLVAAVITVAAWRYDLAIVLPTSDADAAALVRLASRLASITCLLLGLGIVIAAEPLAAALRAPDLKPWLAGVGFVAWAYAHVGLLGYWCNRSKDYGLLSRNKISQSVVTTGTQLGLGVPGLGAAGLILSVFLGQLWGVANLYRGIRPLLLAQHRVPLRSLMREYKKMPLLNAPTAVLDSVRLNGTQLMIQGLFSTASLGQFGQAWRLLQTPAGLINSSLSQVFYQRLSITPRGSMLPLIKSSIVRSTLVGLPVFVAIYLLSPYLFPIILGQPWALAGTLGAALVPWLFLNFVSSPISTVFIVTSRQGTLFWFGLPMTAAPFIALWFARGDIVSAVTVLSWTMAAMLTAFLGLAVWVAAAYDRGAVGGEDDLSDGER